MDNPWKKLEEEQLSDKGLLKLRAKYQLPFYWVINKDKEYCFLYDPSTAYNITITFPKFDNVDDWMVFVYTVHHFEGSLIDSDEGALEWIDNDQILNLNLWEGDKIFIPWLSQDKFFSAKFIYDKKELKDYDVNFY